MRTHNRYERLAPSVDPNRFTEIVRPENLLSAQLEPGTSSRWEAFLNLAFERDGAVALVPFVIVQGMMLLARESSPLVWPRWMPPLRERVARDIEDVLQPWLSSLTMARNLNTESVRVFAKTQEARALVDGARAGGFLGAAPLSTAFLSAAPYAYALRFADGARAHVRDSGGAYGASLLARNGATVCADLGAGTLASLARVWFGLDVYHPIGDAGACDLFVGERAADAAARVVVSWDQSDGARSVEVVEPAPPSITVSFDPADGRIARSFVCRTDGLVTEAQRSALPAMPIIGGSSGRIGIIVRDDAARAIDADLDAANALAGRLNAQGFTAEVTAASTAAVSRYDVVHVIGHRFDTPALSAVVAGVRQARVPLVVTPYLDDRAGEAAWGAIAAQHALRAAPDDASREYYGKAVEHRRLTGPGLPAPRPSLESPEVRDLLQTAGAIVVSTAEEDRRISAASLGHAPTRVVPALLAEEPEPADVSALTGTDGYVLVHAPVEPRANQHLIAAAANRLRVPIVFVGSVVSAEYHADVSSYFGPRAIWIPEESLSRQELAGIYAGARLFADCAWASPGLYRAARAAAFGAALVLPSTGFGGDVWPGIVELADPGSAQSVLNALRIAWDKAGTSAARFRATASEQFDPRTNVVAILALYQAAAKQAVR
jgi:hypothetical protein